jgi:hypothetical protein
MNKVSGIEGFVTISGIKLANGRKISTQDAVDAGLVTPSKFKPSGWDIAKEEIPVGYNTMVDNGRQLLAYLFGGRTPAGSYVCSQFGIGTATDATNTSFTDLISPVNFYDNGSGLQPTKPINGVDFPVPFIARVEFALDTGEAVGTLITELGLYAADIGTSATTLLARKTVTGISKTGDWAPVFLWRVRF